MDNKTFFEKYGTALALFVGLVLIAGALMYGKGASMPTDGTGGDVAAVDIKDVKTEGSPMIGDPNAPVTVAVWFDYQCPFCKQFEETTLASVYNDYVKDGKVKIVYKDFQFLGQYSKIAGRDDSITAALFARAVWDTAPEKFQEWFLAVAAAQDEENAGFGDAASLTTLTRGIAGIDTDRVLSVMETKKAEFTAAIQADQAEGQSLGINGTPAAIIGTTLISGAQPYAKVKPLIDAELAK